MSRTKAVKFQYFAAKLGELCDARNVTQVGLAKVGGVSQSTAHAWLHGLSSPDIAELIALADFFRLPTVDELIRPVPHGDELCVVPKDFLLDAIEDAKEAIRKTEAMLREPSAPRRGRRKRSTGKKTKRS